MGMPGIIGFSLIGAGIAVVTFAWLSKVDKNLIGFIFLPLGMLFAFIGMIAIEIDANPPPAIAWYIGGGAVAVFIIKDVILSKKA